MRRAVPVLITTVLGLGALASFKGAPGGATHITAASVPAATAPAATPSTATPGSSASTVPSPATTVPSATRTVDGDTYSNRYGAVQVRVTLQGTTIVDVTALQLPNERNRSAEISSEAEPYLKQEALQAQSAQIDLVSGATYTSESYASSLQSALDKV